MLSYLNHSCTVEGLLNMCTLLKSIRTYINIGIIVSTYNQFFYKLWP